MDGSLEFEAAYKAYLVHVRCDPRASLVPQLHLAYIFLI